MQLLVTHLSLRGWIIATLIRPNKSLYRILKPSAKGVRRYIHPQAWLGGKIMSPFGIKITRTSFGGVPGVLFSPKISKQQSAIMVFFHGGGYCFGSSLTTHRLGIALMAKETGILCHSVDYRLAPENPYPAALDDAWQAYHQIIQANPNRRIILSGDSAGGGLALALAMKLRDEKGRLPDDLILFSPWTDLTCRGDSFASKAKVDPMFTTSMPRDCSHYYAPEGVDMTDPYISPAFGDVSELPRCLILCGGNEILLSDSESLALKFEDSGGDVELALWPAMFHDWWLFGQFIPETKQCLTKVSQWLGD